MTVTRRTVLGGSLAAAAVSSVPGVSAAAAASTALPGLPALTNLAHLDYLGASVSPPSVAGHSTYGSGPVGVLWTYADRRDDGSYARVGGGAYNPSTNTYGQGAFNADDLARAAVVYLRHYSMHGDAHSRQAAYGLLRGLTFLQTASGANAGNVVLWMQPDGTLNPSADPVELPDPSDSGPAYWLARTVWALGEGYAVFRSVDSRFAAFLRGRLELAIAALERQVLVHYGVWNVVDGRRVPAWLIVAGADATSEAVLGLAAYVTADRAAGAGAAGAGGSARARRALARFAEAIAAMAAGDRQTWPFRALLPWGESISDWHAWGAQMPSALAAASVALRSPRLLEPAIGDAAGFTPLLMTAGGPDNGWLPAPIDRTQIAYGVDARLQALLGVASAANRPGLRQVAAFVGAWYFGANRAGTPMYDPTTGRTYDGISGDGIVNRNSGAESTIHGLLSMLSLDAHPSLAAQARTLGPASRTLSGLHTIEAESAVLSTGATVITPPSPWTGESQWSNNSYVAFTPGSTATWTLPPSDQPQLALPIIDTVTDRHAGQTTWSANGKPLGTINHGTAGPQGTSPTPGALLPHTLPTYLPPNTTHLTTTATPPPASTPLASTVPGSTASALRVDAVLLLPLISQLQLTSSATTAILLTSVDKHRRSHQVTVASARRSVISAYDDSCFLQAHFATTARTFNVPVSPGGFTVIL
ncbi:hypothetical protein [Streptomyces sp. SID13031]|uniref:hypothetical protein n=1 Tax=Streptomyces sp. SID13031 TaxID=2706046 RepID=UPI0013C9D11A|nr:hypothetical protein [Streptomyces sp. SID13031]NEA30956.1 hypothetical protein [Streptomyces sp. SID13031]